MKKASFLILIALLCFTSCDKDEDPHLIDKDRVGLLKKSTRVYELDSIFANDSVVRQMSEGDLFRNSNEIKIYDQSGKQLLLLEPVQAFDTTSTIGYIQVMDPRFETAKGLSTASTFKDIVENYNISRIENTLSAAVIFIDDINTYITISKKELPAELRYDTQTRIQASQIPDEAKIKYFMIGWD
ncbi:hypothetical protein GCM10007103_23420 [Salinimicrobium marinum]|uniref:Uncharacterized protein n=1 Tax=Salinimicrobium marinum TaxID=680283 RepID=A0A918SH36_9FLAO|nr:hypothetical protein [Salinimicrobium marinum]GHA41303.1 hypothetical protein GCM10007103_23420 [Salinimicrobium marinum]